MNDMKGYTKTEGEDGSITFTPIKKEVKCWEDLAYIKGFYLDNQSSCKPTDGSCSYPSSKNVFATEDQCVASEAMAMLSQLMKEVNEGWVPHRERVVIKKLTLYFEAGVIVKGTSFGIQRFLAFETPEIRDRFLELHIDLINQARPLL